MPSGNFNPTAARWSFPCGTPLGSLGTPHPDGGLVMTDLCGVTDGCGVPPPFRCHVCWDATSAWVSPPLGCHFCSGAISAQAPPLLRQMPPKPGCYICSDATSSWVPPLPRYHLRTDATPGVEESRASAHGTEEAAVMPQGTT